MNDHVSGRVTKLPKVRTAKYLCLFGIRSNPGVMTSFGVFQGTMKAQLLGKYCRIKLALSNMGLGL